MKSMKNTMKCLIAVFMMAMAFAVTGITAEAAVTNLQQTSGYDDSLGISFVKDANYRYYGVEVAKDVNFTQVVYRDYTTGTTDYISSGLVAGSTYYVRVGCGNSYNDCYANWCTPIDVVTAPSDLTTLQWYDSNDTQVAIKFYAPGANYYAVYNNSRTLIGTTNKNAVLVSVALPKSYYYVQPLRVSSSGFVAEGYSKSVDYSVLTTKIAKKNFGLDYVYSGLNEVSVGAAYYGTGLQVEIANVGSSKYKKSATSTGSTATVPYKQNRYLKYRVRAYVQTDAGIKYGGWSDYRAFAEMNGKYTPKYKSVYLKWSKMKGTGKIKVQVSTKKDSKYKTFKTLKGSAKSVTVNKYGKKALGSRKYYYVKITPMVKIGKKYVASDYYLQQYFRTR